MSIMVDDLLDAEGAAAHVGCSVGTIRYRMRNGGLTPTLVIGGAFLFTGPALDAYFGEHPLAEDGRRRKRPRS